MNENILELNGLSVGILEQLSYESNLRISIKKNLHYFDKNCLIKELSDMAEWYDEQIILEDVALDYRIKSIESILSKYDRYYPDAQTRKVFNDILGFRAFCDSYDSVLDLRGENFRIADMSNGKLSLRRCWKMCYLIAKNKNAHGCYAIKTRHGSHLVEMKRRMNQQVAAKGIQLVTISRPTAYGEYAPYTFINDESEFEKLVQEMAAIG